MIFVCKQKTAYEMRISDWSSDVCSSDLPLLDRLMLSLSKHEETRLFLRPGGEGHRVAGAGLGAVARHVIQHRHVERSEERRVGKECVSTCRSRRSAYH